jgi:peptidoglycan hydrolase CwlO-like protein
MQYSRLSVWVDLQESKRFLTKMFAESNRQRKKNESFLNKKFAEGERLTKEGERILTEKFSETDRQMKETDRKILQYREDYEKRQKKIEGYVFLSRIRRKMRRITNYQLRSYTLTFLRPYALTVSPSARTPLATPLSFPYQ